MNKKASIAAQLTADRSKWTADLNKAAAEGKRFVNDMKGMKGTPGFMNPGTGKWADMAGKLNIASAAAQGVGMALDKVKEAAQVEMDFESNIAGLSAVSDGTETLRQQLDALAVLGDKPGLGFEQVIKGAVSLQAVKQSASQARDTMEQFGNAVALVGGGKQQFEEVTMSLRQMLSTNSVDMENLKEIATRIPQFLDIANGIDKTSAAGFVTAAVEELKKLPRAATTANEALSNLDDAFKKKLLATSQGRAVQTVKDMAAAAQSAMSGDWGKAGTSLWSSLKGAVSGADLISENEVSESELNRRRAAAKAAADAKQAAGEMELGKLDQQAGLESELTIAKEAGDQQAIADLEDEIDLVKELADLVKKTGVDEATATDFIRRRNQARRDEAEVIKVIADLKEREEKAKSGSKAGLDTATDIAITEAEARGDTKKADKLRRKQSRDAQEQSLIAEGVDPASAAAMADRNSKAQEDLDYFNRTGRRKTKGAVSRGTAGGLGGGLGRGGGFLTPSALATTDEDRTLAETRNATRGKAGAGSDPVLTVLNEIKSALLANRPSVAERTKSR